jgi:hypothetical protein
MMKQVVMALLLSAAALAEPVDGGTQVTVQVDDNGDTTLDVKRGNVKVKSGGKETRVTSGESVRAEHGKPLRHALAAPAPLAPADGSTAKSNDVPLSWQKVPGAARYTVEIAAVPDFATVTAAQMEPTPAARMKLPAGTWWWRVSAVDGEGTRGKPSPARKLVVDPSGPKLKTGKPEWR